MGMKLPKKFSAKVIAASITKSKVNQEPVVEYTVTIPVPPSVNNLFITRGKRRFKSQGYKEWLSVVGPMMAKAGKASREPVEIEVTVKGPINQSRDLDNLLKPVGDCLTTSGVISEDCCRVVKKWSIEYNKDEKDKLEVVTVRVVPWSENIRS
jgi:Holliday junction resolvase RusA-like endonuclease